MNYNGRFWTKEEALVEITRLKGYITECEVLLEAAGDRRDELRLRNKLLTAKMNLVGFIRKMQKRGVL